MSNRELAETILAQLYPEVDEDGIPYLPHVESVLTIELLIEEYLLGNGERNEIQ